MISSLGSTLLISALFFNVYTILSMFIFLKFKKNEFKISSFHSLYSSTFLIILSSLLLIRELIQSNFDISYIAKYSSSNTPLIYKITGFWAGMEGSLLFWLFVLSLYSVIVIVIHKRNHQVLMPWVVIILMFIQLFFLIICCFFEDPFKPVETLFKTGSGLNPLLQHPLMVIHPPLLYLGYIGFSVPFAFAIAALMTKNFNTDWISTTRRWVLFPWGCLSIAIVLGGRWAYLELGWGGYWAWDPVENASLFPWLTGTAYLHSILIQEKKNMLKGWNIILIMLTFTLTIFGTYLTRSGIISSIHAFAATDLGIWFFGFIVIIVVFNIVMLYLNKDILKSQNKLDSVLSRESGFLFNNMLFVAICIAVLWGTMYPVISEAFTGTQITLGPSYFNKVIQPFGVILVFLTGVGPLLSWRKTSVKSIKRNFTIPIILSAIMTLIWLSVYKVFSFYPVMFTFLVLFVIIVIIFEFQKAISARRRTKNENFLNAFKNLINKNRTRYGGYIVHLAIMIMTIGFIGKAFDKEANLSLSPNEVIELEDYTINYKKYWLETPESNPNKRENHFAKIISLEVLKNNKMFSTLYPEKRFYIDQNNQPHSEVALESTLLEDFYVVLGDVDMNTGMATLIIKINPMVNWVWIGTLLLCFGVIICLNPKIKS